MSSQSVRVLNVTHVFPSPSPPHAGAGDDDGDVIKLSFLDTMFVALPPLKRLFFYDAGVDGDGDGHLPPFPAMVNSLRCSLAATLAAFPPLAGKLTHRASHDDVVIDCSAGAVSPGVAFVEAEYDGGGVDDMRRLAGDDEHHTEAFKMLVPEMDVARLPAPLLAVQVTRPVAAAAAAGDGAGIVAVGVSIHHVVGDGQAVWQFMRAWSTASREASPPEAMIPVVFDRKAVVRHPRDEEIAREFVRVFAPALPLVDCSLFPEPDVTRQWRKTYQLRPNQIQSLKQHILHAAKQDKLIEPPTTHVAILSLYWTSLIRAKFMTNNVTDIAGGGDVYFMIPGDLRRRLRPPVAVDGYFGNCVKPCYLSAPIAALCAGDGMAVAAAAMRDAIIDCLDGGDPLAGVERWSEAETRVARERIAQVSSSHRFMAYGTDFGWGPPRRVELVSVYRMDVVALLAAAPAKFAGGGGGVQVSVALDRAHMQAFERHFLRALDTESDSSS
uniref:Anthocyanin acyltransferase n=1 Tax=Leersia perrieri TaxID=77586 RepID=A0A0D9WLQ9_9ORYZ